MGRLLYRQKTPRRCDLGDFESSTPVGSAPVIFLQFPSASRNAKSDRINLFCRVECPELLARFRLTHLRLYSADHSWRKLLLATQGQADMSPPLFSWMSYGLCLSADTVEALAHSSLGSRIDVRLEIEEGRFRWLLDVDVFLTQPPHQESKSSELIRVVGSCSTVWVTLAYLAAAAV